jgi:hypothetical protein
VHVFCQAVTHCPYVSLLPGPNVHVRRVVFLIERTVSRKQKQAREAVLGRRWRQARHVVSNITVMVTR